MKENKDPAIKLFGKKIPLPADDDSSVLSGEETALQVSERHVVVVAEEDTETEKDSQSTTLSNSDTVDNSPNPKTPSIDENTKPKTTSPNINNDHTIDEDKTLKKPDKILPCPRCNSMDTKFCYFNNYNVNQPRHFCKACQRYWTAGGTMRNVPVGAGRRKNKNSPSAAAHFRQVAPPANATVLSFAEAPAPNKEDCTSGSSVTVPEDAVPVPATWQPPYPQFCGPPGFPMPFFPYWNCAVPWFSGAGFSGLGKRVREGEERRSGGGGVLVPKTLRIDDPSEAAKSSIWATLGIKNEGVGILKAFQSKSENKVKSSSVVIEPSLAHMANPAALSRSLNFHETA